MHLKNNIMTKKKNQFFHDGMLRYFHIKCTDK